MTLQLDNGDNWSFFYGNNISALKVTNSQHAPISSITIQSVLDSPVLAVYPTSLQAKPTWKWAGFLAQESLIGEALGLSGLKAVSKRRIWLNQINVIIFPEHTKKYYISIEPPYWFQDINLKVWKYTGPIRTTDDLLLEIRQQEIQRIESKIDDIATYNH